MTKIVQLAVLVSSIMPLLPANAQPAAKTSFWKSSYQPEAHFANIDVALQRYEAMEKRVLMHGEGAGTSVLNSFAGGPAAPVYTPAQLDQIAQAERMAREKDIGDYLRAGVNLSDVACDAWLSSLGRSDRDTSLQKDILNIVGNAIIGIAGINGASSSSLARGALGLSAANASFEAFRNEILMGAISDIETKLKEGRKITAATIKQNIPDNYDDAKGMLMAYHGDCSPTGVKALLKGSLAAVKYAPADTGLTDALRSARSAELAIKLTNELNGGKQNWTISDDDLYALYVLQSVSAEDDTPVVRKLRTAAHTQLLNQYTAGNLSKRNALLQEIAVHAKFKERYDADVASEEKRLKAADDKAKADQLAQESSLQAAKKQVPAADLAKLTAETRKALDKPIGDATPEERAAKLITYQQVTARLSASTNPNTKKLVQETKVLADKVAQSGQVQLQLASARNAPVLYTPNAGAYAPHGGSPVSVNAVLVPRAGTDK